MNFLQRGQLRLLAVEDNQLNKKLLEILLRQLGIQDLVAVENGQLALEAVRQKKFDIAMLDYRLPDLNGLELADEIIKIQPNLKSALVFLTASIDRMEIARLTEYSHGHVIIKPYRRPELAQVIDSIQQSLNACEQN